MRKIFFTTILAFVLTKSFSQNRLPEGWDTVLLDGKPAYMNLVTGKISFRIPQKPAKEPQKQVEKDPTIIHIVVKGETLSSIARLYHKSLATLYLYNNLENLDALAIGQEIVIGYKDTVAEVRNEKYDIAVKENYHTVEPNETLYRIAKRYNISVATLKSLNGLDSNTIIIGQKLIIK